MPQGLEFLDQVTAALKQQLSATVLLSEFLARPSQLGRMARQIIVAQALWLLESGYVHLPQKRAMYAVEPLQQLRLLHYRLEQTPEALLPHDLVFHREMTRIFTMLRDLHTNYLLPSPYRETTVFLPFFIEEYYEQGEDAPRYLVSKVLDGYDRPPFGAGCEVLDWNGIPIRRAIELIGDLQAGSNMAARHACGLDALTIRPLIRSLPPDEHWVTVGYSDPQGGRAELRQEWLAFAPKTLLSAPGGSPAEGNQLALGYDMQTTQIQEARKIFFAQPAIRAEIAATILGTPQAAPDSIETLMPTIFRARRQPTGSGTFGYIRIFTFMIDDAVGFVREFVRLVEQLPYEGLIIDVRGNGGGLILAAEYVLQALTPRRIEPERFQFINTPITSTICRSFPELEQWSSSISQSVETGALHSLGFPVSDPEAANQIGQAYSGAVLLITDARCYSATDIFAAGFRDHQIGLILGTDQNTGAGGANVWRYSDLRSLVADATGDELPNLPQGTELRVAVRRSLRVGQNAGVVLEDLGIRPDRVHQITRRDLLENNTDLLDAAGALLAAMISERPPSILAVSEITSTTRRIKMKIAGLNVATLGISINGVPVTPRSIGARPAAITIPIPETRPVILELSGWTEDGRLVVRRRIVEG